MVERSSVFDFIAVLSTLLARNIWHRVRGDDSWVISVIDVVELSPNTRLAMRHIDDYPLQLIGLRRPLQDGAALRVDLQAGAVFLADDLVDAGQAVALFGRIVLVSN